MHMKVSDAVETVVRLELPRFSPEDHVLWVNIDARAYHYKDGKDTKETRDIHLLFHRPGNYTKVFWHTVRNDIVRLRDIPKDGWVLESDHDSCWTSDGLASPLSKIRQDMLSKFHFHGNIQDVSWHVNFSVFSGVKLYEATLERGPSRDPYDREYAITIGKELKSIGN